jgi:hypothetical protein
MNTIIKSAALISAVSLLAACGGDETSDSSVAQNYHNITTTLQGSIFNAIDGRRITDDTLKITLVQGSDYRAATVRTGTADEFAGDYSLGGIPTATGAGNITYRLTSNATGYQPFEAIMAFNVVTTGLQDSSVNTIGNIYMYPLGTNASDVKVNVTYNNEPIVGATVLMNPNTSNNTITTDITNRIALSSGLQKALTATTDASGVATFEAAGLVLGGQYDVDVMPIAYEGSQLSISRGATFTVGATTTTRNVAMASSAPGTSNGLYVTSASNSDSDNSIVSSGVLTVKFSRAVSLVNEKTINATLAGGGFAVLDNAAFDNRVTAAVSADGLTLTLTPNFSTLPVPFAGSNSATADNALTVLFSNVQLRLVDANDSSTVYDLGTNLVNQTGAAPSLTVKVTPQF